ncbi:MAG: hypothetical protein H6R24_2511 [Proteobacteria bacterium]|nr:hypothetical protein [Pseudomonadota bacterium]
MPVSPEASDEASSSGQGLAIAAESLYLINLLVLPGLGFLALLGLFFRYRRDAPSLARIHLQQTLSASLWAGVLLIVANLLIVVLGGYDSGWTWVVAILYFTTAHTTLVFFGIFGLARAMAGQPYRYPLVGNLLS